MAKIDLKNFAPYIIENLKRIGSDFDGGYVIHLPSLVQSELLINYGIGYNFDFELDYIKTTQNEVYAFDPTLGAFKNIFKSKKISEFKYNLKLFLRWRIFKKRIERKLKKEKINFINQGISNKIENKYKTYEYHLEKFKLKDKKIIFKIDVEGAEYPFFAEHKNIELLKNAFQIIVEFHFLNKKLADLYNIINDLSSTHSLIHIHGNNFSDTFDYNGKAIPKTLECTFLLNDFFRKKEYYNGSYPLKTIDSPCNELKEDIIFDFYL